MPNYEKLLADAGGAPAEEVIAFLTEELPLFWAEEYRATTPRATNLLKVRNGGFEYVYDCYSELEKSGGAPASTTVEDRLVGALGCSGPPTRKREAARMKGWIGPTEKVFGAGRDKGHFIAHTIGGIMDGLELNVFSQRRDLNRGWSAAGRRFREMETYCAAHAGTFCFHRPLYRDESCCPAILEFGVLIAGNRLWVERFEN